MVSGVIMLVLISRSYFLTEILTCRKKLILCENLSLDNFSKVNIPTEKTIKKSR